jgi:hypothetical protein
MSVPFVTRTVAIMQANRNADAGVVRSRLSNTGTSRFVTRSGVTFSVRHLDHTAALNGL